MFAVGSVVRHAIGYKYAPNLLVLKQRDEYTTTVALATRNGEVNTLQFRTEELRLVVAAPKEINT